MKLTEKPIKLIIFFMLMVMGVGPLTIGGVMSVMDSEETTAVALEQYMEGLKSVQEPAMPRSSDTYDEFPDDDFTDFGESYWPEEPAAGAISERLMVEAAPSGSTRVAGLLVSEWLAIFGAFNTALLGMLQFIFRKNSPVHIVYMQKEETA